MSCYWAPRVSMRTNPQDNVQHMFYKALHTFCRGTDMERHRRNATEKLRDRRRQGDQKCNPQPK